MEIFRRKEGLDLYWHMIETTINYDASCQNTVSKA